MVENPSRIPRLEPDRKILWHELKKDIRCEVKVKVKQELIDGIQAFWRTLHIPKCNKYINHLRKVIPKVIELNGDTISENNRQCTQGRPGMALTEPSWAAIVEALHSRSVGEGRFAERAVRNICCKCNRTDNQTLLVNVCCNC